MHIDPDFVHTKPFVLEPAYLETEIKYELTNTSLKNSTQRFEFSSYIHLQYADIYDLSIEYNNTKEFYEKSIRYTDIDFMPQETKHILISFKSTSLPGLYKYNGYRGPILEEMILSVPLRHFGIMLPVGYRDEIDRIDLTFDSQRAMSFLHLSPTMLNFIPNKDRTAFFWVPEGEPDAFLKARYNGKVISFIWKDQRESVMNKTFGDALFWDHCQIINQSLEAQQRWERLTGNNIDQMLTRYTNSSYKKEGDTYFSACNFSKYRTKVGFAYSKVDDGVIFLLTNRVQL